MSYIHRAFKISSSYIIPHNELEKVKILLQKNMYPIDNQFKTFLDKQFTEKSYSTSEKQKTLHYSLPYIGHFSHVTKKKLGHLNTRIEDLLGKHKKSHIYSHLQENPQCQEKINFDGFEIIDRAATYFRLQILKAMHINCKKTNSTNRLNT